MLCVMFHLTSEILIIVLEGVLENVSMLLVLSPQISLLLSPQISLALFVRICDNPDMKY